MSLLAIEDLAIGAGDLSLVDGVTLSVEPGEVVALVGESGSGKSLTALSIMGLLADGLQRQRGSILFDGTDLTQLADEPLRSLRGSELAMIFQEPVSSLNPLAAVGDQVAESLIVHGRASASDASRQAIEMLRRVGIPEPERRARQLPTELSGGMCQRVMIAAALISRPRLLIADEPTTALDVTTQAGILELLKSLQEEEGLALMLISHDLAVVSNMADDVVVMRQGRIVEQGDLGAVFGRPEHDYTHMLFEASALTRVARTPASPEPSMSARSETPLLEVEDLVCEYPGRRTGLFSHGPAFRAVNRVSFEIRRGESVGLVGESGCGKSTLTRALLGLMHLHAGRIRLDNEEVSAARVVSRKARRQMQVVFQDPYGSFNPRHRVARLISEPLHLLDDAPGRKETRQRVSRVLESVGLAPDDGNKFIHEFSGGQRQRIAIARSLIIQPSLIILDEAVSALDVSVRAQVLQLLDTLAREQGLAYLFISHDLSVVQRVSDRVLVMQQGQIVEQGDTAAVFMSPQHAYTRQLLAATPQLRIPSA